MGIIKRADLDSYTRDAVPMDLGDLQRRGVAVVNAAQEEAAKILRDAQAERDRLVGDASEVGRAEGFKEGHDQGLKDGTKLGTQQAHQDHGTELDGLLTQWSTALSNWEHDRSELMLAARTEVIELAAQIASRVIKRTIDLDPEVVVDQLDSVLDSLVTPTDIRVRVHPDDLELLNRVMPSMIAQCAACNHAELVEDKDLTPGSCVVATKGGGEIDASIARQLDRVVAALLPAHRGPEYDKHLEDTPLAESEDHANPDSKDDAA